MRILGISAFYHDSAASIIVNGEIIAAAQEERFTRKKHDDSFPVNAIEYCLQAAGITADQLDYVAFYEKPLLKFDRLWETYISYAPMGFPSFVKALPIWLKQKLFMPREIDKGLKNRYSGPILFPTHHETHAASAFFPSPYSEAAILTIDGVGEWSTTTIGVGEGNKMRLLKEIRFPHSLGLLYSAFTYYTGFRVNSGEYKLMGLAPYGRPIYAELIRKHLIDIKEDGS
ncbi:MAG: carbamoyltransferase N-terminal domain-containing protein, partial [Pseudomonadota bacterium]